MNDRKTRPLATLVGLGLVAGTACMPSKQPETDDSSLLDYDPDPNPPDPKTWTCPIDQAPDFITSECLQQVFSIITALAPLEDVESELERVCEEIQETFIDPIEHSTGDESREADLSKLWAKYKSIYNRRYELWRDGVVKDGTEPPPASVIDLEHLQSEFPCGEGPHGHTFCEAGAASFEEGGVVVLNALVEAEAFPLEDAMHHHQVALVLDRDGKPENNYVADGANPKDGFIGGDFFVQAIYGPAAGWEYSALQTNEAGELVPADTDIRLNIYGNSMSWFIPEGEVTEDSLYRLWNFTHLGDWGFDEPWNGDAEPPVGLNLAKLIEF